MDCIFCKIVRGQIPSPRIAENDAFICIADLHPQASTHWLVIPKLHIASLEHATPELVGKLFEFAKELALEKGLLPHGYRSVINTGPGGGQSVFHLHLHILAGELTGRFG